MAEEVEEDRLYVADLKRELDEKNAVLRYVRELQELPAGTSCTPLPARKWCTGVVVVGWGAAQAGATVRLCPPPFFGGVYVQGWWFFWGGVVVVLLLVLVVVVAHVFVLTFPLLTIVNFNILHWIAAIVNNGT